MKRLLLALAALCLLPVPVLAQQAFPVSTADKVYAPLPDKPKVVSNVVSNGRYKWVDTRKTDVRNATFNNITLNVDRYGFAFGPSYVIKDGKNKGQIVCHAGSTVTINNLTASLRKPTKGGDFPAAVGVSDSGCAPANIIINGGVFSNFRQVEVKGKYTQGDGIDCDNRRVNLTIRNVAANNNSDGGFDSKCNSTYDNLSGEGNGITYRMWGRVRAGTLTSISPRKGHIQTTGGTDAVIELLIAEGSNGKPVVGINSPTGESIEIKACRFNFTVPTPVIGGPSKFVKPMVAAGRVKLGPTCQPDANGFAVNSLVASPERPPERRPEPPPVVSVCSFAKPLRDSDKDGVIELGAANRAKCQGARRVRLISPPATARALSADPYSYEAVK